MIVEQAVAVLLVLLAIADGSLLARLGRAHEQDVGTELLKARDVLAVISGVSSPTATSATSCWPAAAASPSRSRPPSAAAAT